VAETARDVLMFEGINLIAVLVAGIGIILALWR